MAHGTMCSLYIFLQYMVVLLMTILLDIIQLGLYYDDGEDSFGDGDSK